jgi:putative ATPase
MTNLFEAAGMDDQAPRPLADRLRPEAIGDVVGQDHLLQDGAPLARMIDSSNLSSIIFWGPPGTGKTTIARLLANVGDLEFVQLSAIFTGVADLRKVFDVAKGQRQQGRGTLLFIDEVHRFNRSQQDGFLPHMENGTIILIGATTENPSFELNGALLSRAQVMVLNRLGDDALEQLLMRTEALLGQELPLTADARASLRAMADGDGRYLLNMTETILNGRFEAALDTASLVQAIQQRAPVYDKGREEHYNLISALHKSIRGSDADAALYWLARMLAGGEDPMFVARRLVRASVEDIGLADPAALTQALASKETYEFLGSPEGELALAQTVIYLATAPKSNAAYTAFSGAKAAAHEHGSLMPPKHILNAPTQMMKDQGYGSGYEYDHDTEEGFSGRNYFPDAMNRQEFYKPSDRGFEKEVEKRLSYWGKLRDAKQKKGG